MIRRLRGKRGTWMAAVWAGMLAACIMMGENDRVAGSSTEAGNAGGKLSKVSGAPAAGIPVVLVAAGYLPDTLPPDTGSLAGAYYRARSDDTGGFLIAGIMPGMYRLFAVGDSGGVLVDSLDIRKGPDTSRIRAMLGTLGRIRGVIKLKDQIIQPRIMIKVRGSLKAAFTDASGRFVIDSLPAGSYELLPVCVDACEPSPRKYKVGLKSGQDTLLPDTLPMYANYFRGFPPESVLALRASILPTVLAGKINRGSDYEVRPSSLQWTWNGAALPSQEVYTASGIAETSVRLDSALFGASPTGKLRLALRFPDTMAAKTWTLVLDTSRNIWGFHAVAVSDGMRIARKAGREGRPVWRFQVRDRLALGAPDLAFWPGLAGGALPTAAQLPATLDLALDEADQIGLEYGIKAANLTFMVVPDGEYGGRAFRFRRDEDIRDFAKIRYRQRLAWAFRDSLVPSMLPDALYLERLRGAKIRQRYRVDSAGAWSETTALDAGPGQHPILYFRSAPADTGFSWNLAGKGGGKHLIVLPGGKVLATRDRAQKEFDLPRAEMDSLQAIVAALTAPSAHGADTLELAHGTAADLEYLWSGGRGLLRIGGGRDKPADSLFAGFRNWVYRNRLDEEPRYPLQEGATANYLGFSREADTLRYTGDTLVLAIGAPDSGGYRVKERLSSGSPGRASDSAVTEYRLSVEGDSLAVSAPSATSRIFGRIKGKLKPFPLAGLAAVRPPMRGGFPELERGVQVMSGRLEGMAIRNRTLTELGLMLDARDIVAGFSGVGFLYTENLGVVRVWRYDGKTPASKGWDLE